jgi:hypothetical protein
MGALRVLLPLLLLPAPATESFARSQPPFRFDAAVWEATHIVVVTEGEKIDGVVEVLESWKGDLRKGERITVPALAAFASAKMRVIWKRRCREDTGPPAAVTCSRMVLFLIRQQDKADGGRPGKTTWLPANLWWKEIRIAPAWIEADHVFAFAQQLHPGPSRLVSWGMNECGLKSRVDAVLAARTALAEAIRQDNPAKLVTAVPPLLRSDSEYVREAVIWTLGKAGANSLPALRNILKDESLREYHACAIQALAEAGGVAVGPELTELLKEELALWKKVGPGLKVGWWNEPGLPWEEVIRLRDHYLRAAYTLDALKTVRFAGCRETVSTFRDFLRSLSQLGGFDLPQMVKACDEVLASLR